MSSFSRKLIIFGAEYLILAEGLVFLILVSQKDTRTEASLFFFSGIVLILLSLLMAHILKLLFHKKRPPKEQELFPPGDIYAFPSKHAATLTALNLFVFQESLFYGTLVLCLGIIIVTCRVLAQVHRTQDIFFGIVLGGVTAYIVMPYVLAFTGGMVS